MPAPELPVEIVEQIILPLWTSRLSTADRVALMTACPLLTRTWKGQFARMASTFIYIPRLSYLLYLANIIRTGNSIIYDKWDLQHRAQTVTCFLYAIDPDRPPYRIWDEKTFEVYRIFTFMGNYVGLRMCFPSVHRLHLESLLHPIWHWHPALTHPGPQGPFALAWTRIAIVFDEKVRTAPYPVIKKVPSTLSSYRTQFDVEIVLLGSFPPDLEPRYPRYLEFGMLIWLSLLVYNSMFGLCSSKWSERRTAIRRPYRQIASYLVNEYMDIPQKLYHSRTKHQTGVGFSLQCNETLTEYWETDDVMDVKIQLWRAGRAGRKSILGPSSVCMEVWRYLCGSRMYSNDWKRSASNPYWSLLTYNPPDPESST